MRRLIPLALLALLALPQRSDSTVVEALDHASMVERSASILWGDCVEVSSEYTADRERIVTRVTMAPREVLKGEDQALVEVTFPGGTVGDRTYVIHGMPSFRQGQEVVVYLSEEAQASGVRVPMGLSQGFYTVDRTGTAAMAVRDLRGVTLVGPSEGRGSLSSASHGELEQLPLDDLLSAIRAEVAEAQ